MESTEELSERLKRVDMHDYFRTRIKTAMNSGNYIEANWLIYACFENRYFRTVQKYRLECKYCRSKSKCNKKEKNGLALLTKVGCVQRLFDAGVTCITGAFNQELFEETTKWVKKRNDMMHDLLSLEYYENTDALFKESAEKGLNLLNKTYECCTKFRALFFAEDYKFVMPDEAAEKCPCKPKEGK